MLAIRIEFLHGWFRGDPDGTAITGRLAFGEWPPSPFRLFAALVASDGTRDRCRVTSGAELEWFERLPPPTIRADMEPYHQRLRPRYVVRQLGKAVKNTHQGYLAREGTLVRPGIRVTPRDPRVVYAWDVTPPRSTLQALRLRAARVGYVGAADSPVRVRVMTEEPDSVVGEQRIEPSVDGPGDLFVNVPAPGDVQRLDSLFDAWRERGANLSRSQFPALRHGAPYDMPRSALRENGEAVIASLRLEAAVSGRTVSRVTHLFKQAVLRRYQEIYGTPPAVLHGHGFDDRGYELARFLALPDVGFARSRGRIHGLALWMPPGSGAVDRLRARDAALAVRRLVGEGVDVAVSPNLDEEHPIAANPARWCRQACSWITAIPVIHERHGRLDLREVARWCRNAGLPEPVWFRSARGPLVHGAIDLSPVEVHRPGRPGRPYSHVELRFAEPVRGPVVIGAGRQRGFGLCVPVTD